VVDADAGDGAKDAVASAELCGALGLSVRMIDATSKHETHSNNSETSVTMRR
jgi:hypothetical protein